MSRMMKWLGFTVAGILVFITLAGATLHFVGERRLNRAPSVQAKSVAMEADAEAIRQGARLATISYCGGCHGMDLSGQEFIDDPAIGYVAAPNLTAGEGGIGAHYTAGDWARAIRHGIGADGRPLVIMPSEDYAAYGDKDLAALIAYLQAISPVDRVWPERRITFPGTIIFGILAYNSIAAVNHIDHDLVGTAAPPAGPTAEYGDYLAQLASCRSCHGGDLGGNLDGEGPQGPNISPGSPVGSWSQEDFFVALRTGNTPDGRQLDTAMPWPAYTLLSDMELTALWNWLQSVPAVPAP